MHPRSPSYRCRPWARCAAPLTAGLALIVGVGHAGAQPAVRLERVPCRTQGNPSSFGQDADGELYLLDLDGGIYRIVSDG